MSEAVKKFMERCPVAVGDIVTNSPREHTQEFFIALMPTKRQISLRAGSSMDGEKVEASATRFREWLEDVLEEFEESRK